MIIKEIYIGNKSEAYIEKRFNNRLNILYSDDNHKGKTIVIQSIMYCLGNDNPAFPEGFEFKKYIYILKVESNNNTFYICRKNNVFFILKNEKDYIKCDSLGIFKKFWNNNIQKIPLIIKSKTNKKMLVDLELLIQLFFIGQDKKNTSDIVSRGWYNKDDFYNMLFLYDEFVDTNNYIDEVKKIKNEIKELEQTKSLVKFKEKYKNNMIFAEPKIQMISLLKDIANLVENIKTLVAQRNKKIRKKFNDEEFYDELIKLRKSKKNKSLWLECLKCNSTDIFLKTKDFKIEINVLTDEKEKQILNSILNDINVLNEEIESITAEINKIHLQINELLNEENITIEELLITKLNLSEDNFDLNSISEITDKIKTKNQELKKIDKKRDIKNNNSEKLQQIVNFMNEFNKTIDTKVEKEFNDIFSKPNTVYSGSESTQFYLAKIYAIAKFLNHNYPILVDSFRAEELATDKEKMVIEKYLEFNNQIIFTATIKEEERLKYKTIKNVNSIDYSQIESYHLLQKKYLKEFNEKLELFPVAIELQE